MLKHNNRNRWLMLPLLLLMPGFLSCQGEADRPVLPDVYQWQEAFIESNKYLNILEEEAIDDFIERFGWEMQRTGTGLRYKIDRKGEGPNVAYGDLVVVNYTVYLMTGDPVYSSANDEPLVFVAGRGGVESGLEEGIRLLNNKAMATFILPSYLAHGLPGDGHKIPRRSAIIYEIEVMGIY